MNKNGSPENLIRFSSEHQPKNNGRKPSKLKKYIKENNLSAYDMKLILGKFHDMPREKLQELVKNPKTPILISGIAAALLHDMAKGYTYTLQWLVDRGYGTAIQKIELSGGVDPVAKMTPEDRQKYIDELLLKRATEVQEENGEEKND